MRDGANDACCIFCCIDTGACCAGAAEGPRAVTYPGGNQPSLPLYDPHHHAPPCPDFDAMVAPLGKVSWDCRALPWKGCFARYRTGCDMMYRERSLGWLVRAVGLSRVCGGRESCDGGRWMATARQQHRSTDQIR